MSTTPSSEQNERTPRWRRVLVLAAKACAGVVVFALVLELLVTAVFGTQVRFPRRVVDGGFGVRVNEPGASYRHVSPDVDVAFRINARGLRADRDYEYAKPAGVRRVVTVGDSFTVGYEVEVEECFSSVLERELEAQGRAVEVLNAGVSGYSNAEALVYLERELLKYEPDVVVLTFFNNDLVDNVRTKLFRLNDDGSVERLGAGYIPLGGIGDFLNTNTVFNALSERSNAFALLLEETTHVFKRKAVRENRENMNLDASRTDARYRDQKRLAAGILDHLYAMLHERGVTLVVQSIPLFKPTSADGLEGQLLDAFPYDDFDSERDGLELVKSVTFLAPLLGVEPLYHLRSHMHWTPRTHELSGQALARVVGAALDAADAASTSDALATDAALAGDN